MPADNLLGLSGVPDLHVMCNGVVIGSGLHEAIVVVGLKMMRTEPHTHIHGIELGGETAIEGTGPPSLVNSPPCPHFIATTASTAAPMLG